MSSKNNSGIKPVEYHILYTLDRVEEKIGSIHVPDSVRDREERAGIKGTLIDVGPMAFEEWPEDEYPVPGDRIILSVRYAGGEVEGADGETYYLANDKDIAAVVTREKE